MIINGELMKTRRERLGLSQYVLADGICHQSMISRLEKSNHITSMTILNRLCERLQINTSDVMKMANHELSPLRYVREALIVQDWDQMRLCLKQIKKPMDKQVSIRAEYYLLWGKLYLYEGEFEQAMDHLQIAIASVEGDKNTNLIVDIYSELAYAWFVQHNFKVADEMIDQAASVIERIEQRRLPALNNVMILFYLRRAQILFGKGNYYVVLAEVKKAMDLAILEKNYHQMVELQLIRADCAKKIKSVDEQNDAVVLAYAAAKFSKCATLNETVHPYMSKISING